MVVAACLWDWWRLLAVCGVVGVSDWCNYWLNYLVGARCACVGTKIRRQPLLFRISLGCCKCCMQNHLCIKPYLSRQCGDCFSLGQLRYMCNSAMLATH
jgi:hypothetical protein